MAIAGRILHSIAGVLQARLPNKTLDREGHDLP